MPKKILIFSTAYSPFVGGAEVSIKEITDRVNGADFDLITAKLHKKFGNENIKKEEKVGNVTVHRVGFGSPLLDKLLLPFLGAVKAASLNKKYHYSAYWCVMVTWASGAAYIANIFSKNKVPIILTLQEGDSEKHLKYRWLGFLNLSWKLSLKYATEVTAISSYLAERAKRLGYKKEIKVIPNGVDINKFKIENSKLKIGEKGKIALVTVSRLVKKNGIEDLIKAVALLSNKFELHIIGSGELRECLALLSKKLGLDGRVFFRGEIENERLPEILSGYDIFIRPSLSEGMGISFIEAMAAGIPVIGTKVGGIPDFLKDRETGLFCEVNNPQSIADKVIEYVNNPELTSKIVKNGREMVEKRYDWDLISKKYSALFK